MQDLQHDATGAQFLYQKTIVEKASMEDAITEYFAGLFCMALFRFLGFFCRTIYFLLRRAAWKTPLPLSSRVSFVGLLKGFEVSFASRYSFSFNCGEGLFSLSKGSVVLQQCNPLQLNELAPEQRILGVLSHMNEACHEWISLTVYECIYGKTACHEWHVTNG